MIKEYSYKILERLIAQEPVNPRDTARLLVYLKSRKNLIHSDFRHLTDHIPPNAVLVFNETKVIPARLIVTKKTGGKVELLLLNWNRRMVYAKVSVELKKGTKLYITKRLYFTVQKMEHRLCVLRQSFSANQLKRILDRHGHAPLPPYIKHANSDERVVREQYQTVFARIPGSVAAPTASLHFTKRLLNDLRKKGIQLEFVTLHVGLGTFAPVTKVNIEKNILHEEMYSIPRAVAKRLNEAKKEGRPIIAIGTTVVRTLEFAAYEKGVLKKLSGNTSLFIRLGYKFKFVDGMITNFHVPESSLMMLVAAFIGRKELLRVYKNAKRNEYRFYSFGDGMLIL